MARAGDDEVLGPRERSAQLLRDRGELGVLFAGQEQDREVELTQALPERGHAPRPRAAQGVREALGAVARALARHAGAVRRLDPGLGRDDRQLLPLGQEALDAERLDPGGALGVGGDAKRALGGVREAGRGADQDRGAEAPGRGEQGPEGQAPAEGVAEQRRPLEPERERQLGREGRLLNEGERGLGDLAAGVAEQVGGDEALAEARREGGEVGAGAREAVQGEERRLLTLRCGPAGPAGDSQPSPRDALLAELRRCRQP